MKKMLLIVSAVTILGLAFFLSGCAALHRETPKDALQHLHGRGKGIDRKTHNVTCDSIEYGTDGGGDTDDYIYLLSVDEANALDNSVRKCGSWYELN